MTGGNCGQVLSQGSDGLGRRGSRASEPGASATLPTAQRVEAHHADHAQLRHFTYVPPIIIKKYHVLVVDPGPLMDALEVLDLATYSSSVGGWVGPEGSSHAMISAEHTLLLSSPSAHLLPNSTKLLTNVDFMVAGQRMHVHVLRYLEEPQVRGGPCGRVGVLSNEVISNDVISNEWSRGTWECHLQQQTRSATAITSSQWGRSVRDT